ncbi:MAG: hypothetical protein M3Q61_07075, partial [Chloroflexota bacterium]|nr:hypothetical protein [Chloroflexota bacterium]
MSRSRLSDAELEATLREIGRGQKTPDAPHLAARVRARIAERREPRWPWIFALAPALITLLVLAGGAAAVEVVRLRGVDVFRVPAGTAPPRPSPSATARALDLGEPASFGAAQTLVQPLYLSSDPIFGAPDEIYLRRGGNGQVSFVYAPQPGLPAGPTGHGALVTQLRGVLDTSFIGKGVGPGSRVENVRVGDAPGVWIEGQAHLFFYRDGAGNILQETLRLAGNTLLWQRGDS